jgi:TRAP-type uncharacterized transport system fused permease subunit
MKPIFRKAGYDDLAAAGLSANAGTLAIITPPVLGSVAFIIAELLAIPYTTIVIMSIVPAVLYVISIYLYNEYYSRRAGLKHVEISQRESPKIHAFAPAMLIASMIFLAIASHYRLPQRSS